MHLILNYAFTQCNGMKSNLNPYETKSNLTKQNTLEKCPLKFQQSLESWGQLTFTWDS